MSIQRFKSLLFKSTRIQDLIQVEEKTAMPDALKLLKLKKIRLFLKDKMASMVRQGLLPDNGMQMKQTYNVGNSYSQLSRQS